MLRTILAGGVAIFVLLAMVVGLMQLHNPPPAFACDEPVPGCPGCFWVGDCYYRFWYYDGVECCHYNCINCPPQCSSKYMLCGYS